MKDNFISTIPKEFIPYQLPENWKWFLWSDLITNYQQGMIRSNSQLGEGNAEYLKMGDLDSSGRANFSNLARTEASQKEIEEFLLKEGDFLINVRNSKELVGKTCLIQNINNRTVLFNHMLVRMDHGSIELNYYINAFLNIPSSKKMLDRIKQGTTTVIALYQRDLNKIPIPLPDNKTFNNIVELYKSINQKIELNNKINAELEAMAKTLYDYWFVQFDFPVQSKKNPELVEGYKSSGGKMVWNEELKREIPDGWEVMSIDEYAEVKKGELITAKDAEIGEIKVVAAGIGYSYKHSKANRDRNTITISGSGANAGFINFWREPIFASDCITVRGNSDTETLMLLHHLKFIQAHILSQATGSAQPHVYPSDIKVLNYIVPPMNLIDDFGEIIIPMNDKIAVNQKENQELASLRDWLLPMLMNGQVRVASTGSVTENGYDVEYSKLGMVAEGRENYKRS